MDAYVLSNSEMLQRSGLSLATFSERYGLSQEFLSSLGMADVTRDGEQVIEVPYLDVSGQSEMGYLKASDGGVESESPMPYGLWRLDKYKDHLVLVETPTEALILWSHNVPALATCSKDLGSVDQLRKFKTLYVVGTPELPDLPDVQIRVLNTDILELHESPDFDAEFKLLLEESEEYQETAETQEELLEKCREIALSPNILDLVNETMVHVGVIGEEQSIKIIYLALNTRFFDKPDRPVSLVFNGPSSTGKSFTAENVIMLFPSDAAYQLTAMSERSIAYMDEPLSHRFLVIYEANGITSDITDYLVRSLLSEGHIKYQTTEKTAKGALKSRLVYKEGPTGLIMTTAAIAIHPENQTRVIMMPANDTAEQTRAILMDMVTERDRKVDLDKWHAYQKWLKGANKKVVIPFGKAIVESIHVSNFQAMRLRRDFKTLLCLIKAHAIMHQLNRQTGEDGRIIATLEDYKVVRNLVSDLLSDAVGLSVSDEVREIVNAVEVALGKKTLGDTVDYNEIAEVMHRDKSVISRHIKSAIWFGYLVNDEQRKGMPAKIKKGSMALPDEDQVLLPTVEEVQSRFQGSCPF